jgi:site-specific recombinase XerD
MAPEFRQLQNQMSMDTVRRHDFRHCMATTMLAAGVDPKTGAPEAWRHPL